MEGSPQPSSGFRGLASALGPESPILFSWAFSNVDEEIASDVNSKNHNKGKRTSKRRVVHGVRDLGLV